MKLWQSLYLMIWLAFLEILLVMNPLSGLPGRQYLHILLGAGMVALAYWNVETLKTSQAPDRMKRISKSTFQLTVAAGVTGVIFFFIYYFDFYVIHWFVDLLHVGISLTIIAQAASTATGYDMWEEKEIGGPSEVKEAEPEPSAAPNP